MAIDIDTARKVAKLARIRVEEADLPKLAGQLSGILGFMVNTDELERMGAGSLKRAVFEGNETTGCFMAGQSAALVNREQPVAEIITEMFAEARTLLDRAPQMLG